ncbi:fatty acid desaturase 4, chloroplastic-like [Andrographis paniculata]|uniref:fatty acid desaturase 4, chloroplastic-like n=1 Tax=Andrographis paniculata TaxID=175694 RepID=UPI0021E7F893|nr:fatty acid desaturase 4, chloroplastic-like [Andrographis paniculata]
MAMVEKEDNKSSAVHRARFAAALAAVFAAVAKSILLINTPQALLRTTLASLIGYLAADLGSGIYHWAVDNYGSSGTPIFGGQIEIFRAHHRQPSAVTRYDTARLVHIMAVIVTVVVTPVAAAARDPAVLGFFGWFGGFAMFALKIHAWAHMAEGNIPAGVAALQEAGIILRPSWHAAHHRAPFDGTYCSVSGWCNPVLDKLKVFASMEVLLFHVAGVRPQSWAHSKVRRDSGESAIKGAT